MNAEGNAQAFESTPRSPPSLRKVMLACTFLLTFAAVAFLALQPESGANAPSPTETAIGAVLSAGGLYHADAESLDHRALVSARIANLKTTPDVLIIADRKWQLVHQDLRWEKLVFGAYINGLMPDDINEIVKQFEAFERLPRKIVLGISPQFLIDAPIGRHEGKRMPSLDDPGRDGRDLLSMFPLFGEQTDPRPGLMPLDARLDTLFPDGSNIWSTRRSKATQRQDIKTAASELAGALITQVERSAFSQIIETGEAIAEAKSAGIEVVIALTPLHPEIYRQIHESPTTLKMHEGLEDLFSMARGLDVTTLGSFEPYAAGCKARDFASVVVPRAVCLQRSLDAAILADPNWPAIDAAR